MAGVNPLVNILNFGWQRGSLSPTGSSYQGARFLIYGIPAQQIHDEQY